MQSLRRIAIVPAMNEEQNVGRVIDELHAFDPALDVVVVDDGSFDRTAAVARDHGARIRMLAWIVSRIVGRRVTDTTSGFQALNRKAIELFARDYPHDYPEVEATVMVFRHRLCSVEVPVSMRERSGGSSSITALRSV